MKINDAGGTKKPKPSTSGATASLMSLADWNRDRNEQNRRNAAGYRLTSQAQRSTSAAKKKAVTRRENMGNRTARLDWQNGDIPGAQFYSTNKDFIRGYNKAFAIMSKAQKAKKK